MTEEVGELAKQITNEVHRPERFDKNNLGTELTDVLMLIVVLANFYDINLSQEMKNTIERVKQKNS